MLMASPACLPRDAVPDDSGEREICSVYIPYTTFLRPFDEEASTETDVMIITASNTG